MLRNYLTVAIRNLLRQRVYTLINVFGLSVGMTACVLIGLYVLDELRFDRHHEKADRIYRVIRGTQTTEGDTSNMRSDQESQTACWNTVVRLSGGVDYPA